MVADLLPFCSALSYSPRSADRLVWLRIASDLILRTDRAGEALGADFEERFAEFLDLVDEETRLKLAQKLCAAVRSPVRIFYALLQRPDAAAEWTLAHAPRLAPELLREAARSPDLSKAVARRPDLDEGTIDQLLASRELDTRIALAGNASAKLTRDRLGALIAEAHARLLGEQDFRLAAAILSRTPISAEFAPLFLAASPQQRTQILLAAQRAELGRERPSNFGEISQRRIDALERYALDRQPELFVAELAAALGCSQALASRIAGDASGEPLAVALAAIRAPNDVCVRILTSRDMAEGPDYRRLGALARLQGALSVSAARTVISAIVGVWPDDSDPLGAQPRHSAAAVGRGGAEAVRAMRQRRSVRRVQADKSA